MWPRPDSATGASNIQTSFQSASKSSACQPATPTPSLGPTHHSIPINPNNYTIIQSEEMKAFPSGLMEEKIGRLQPSTGHWPIKRGGGGNLQSKQLTTSTCRNELRTYSSRPPIVLPATDCQRCNHFTCGFMLEPKKSNGGSRVSPLISLLHLLHLLACSLMN